MILIFAVAGAVPNLKFRTICVATTDDFETLCAVVQSHKATIPCPLLVIATSAGRQLDGRSILIISAKTFASIVAGYSNVSCGQMIRELTSHTLQQNGALVWRCCARRVGGYKHDCSNDGSKERCFGEHRTEIRSVSVKECERAAATTVG